MRSLARFVSIFQGALRRLDSTTVYQVRVGNRTLSMSSEQWLREQREQRFTNLHSGGFFLHEHEPRHYFGIEACEHFGPTYRFRMMQGRITKEGRFERSKSVGMAYLVDGRSIYTLRLWTLLDARFFLIASKNSLSRFLLMTREPTKDHRAKNKYHWNIVGNGQSDTIAGVIRLDFDLFAQPIYMSIFPESSPQAAKSSTAEGPDFADAFDVAA